MSAVTVTNLSVAFGERTVVKDVSFAIEPGERVCIIGESGSGKSLTARAIIGLLPPAAQVAGSIRVGDQEMIGPEDRVLQRLRGNDIGFVFQEPHTALNPVLRIRHQLVTALRTHRGLRRDEERAVAAELAEQVGLPDPERIIDRFPHELSGGQRQRVVIAMAMSCNPRLLIADEPTTALDATVQAKVLDLMMQRTREQEVSLLMITHDMAVAARTAERLIVMRDGEIVESGQVADILRRPSHQYTRELVRAARATSLRRNS